VVPCHFSILLCPLADAFTVKRVSATNDEIEKALREPRLHAGIDTAPGRRMKMWRIGFLRDESLSLTTLLLDRTSFNDRAIRREKYGIVVRTQNVSEFLRFD